MVYGSGLGPLSEACDLYKQYSTSADERYRLLRYWNSVQFTYNHLFTQKEEEMAKVIRAISLASDEERSEHLKKIEKILDWFLQQHAIFCNDVSSK